MLDSVELQAPIERLEVELLFDVPINPGGGCVSTIVGFLLVTSPAAWCGDDGFPSLDISGCCMLPWCPIKKIRGYSNDNVDVAVMQQTSLTLSAYPPRLPWAG